MATVDETLKRLEKSSFRASFHLSKKELDYFNEKGSERVRRHAEDFIRERLAPAEIPNDGRQTPMRGHPVFVAQHACACCCRGCLEKWYNVKRGRPLTENQQERIVKLLMAWIEKEMGSRIQS
jgi:exodeoxyribonuclease V alpha subunit